MTSSHESDPSKSAPPDVESARQRFLFTRLVLSFQAAAMQQMGKIADPLSGQISRDLFEAEFSIDTLDMLKKRCTGHLSHDEERLLNHVMAELKLNYIDEIGRPGRSATDAPPATATADPIPT